MGELLLLYYEGADDSRVGEIIEVVMMVVVCVFANNSDGDIWFLMTSPFIKSGDLDLELGWFHKLVGHKPTSK